MRSRDIHIRLRILTRRFSFSLRKSKAYKVLKLTKNMQKRGLIIILFLMLLIAVPFVSAENIGYISGGVFDEDINPLAGAQASLGGITIATDNEGQFSFFSTPFPPGKYELKIILKGYETYTSAVTFKKYADSYDVQGVSVTLKKIVLPPATSPVTFPSKHNTSFASF